MEEKENVNQENSNASEEINKNEEKKTFTLEEVEKMKSRKTMEKEPIYDIEATIYCIKESHKGIIIGKKRSNA